jgi:hypothetical protein
MVLGLRLQQKYFSPGITPQGTWQDNHPVNPVDSKTSTSL